MTPYPGRVDTPTAPSGTGHPPELLRAAAEFNEHRQAYRTAWGKARDAAREAYQQHRTKPATLAAIFGVTRPTMYKWIEDKPDEPKA